MFNKTRLINAIKIVIFLFVLFIFSACNKAEKVEKRLNSSDEQHVKKDSIPSQKSEYVSKFKTDSTLQKKDIDFAYLSSDKDKDTLMAFCNCEKNVKNNTLKIQIRTAFPPKSELEAGKRGNRLVVQPTPVQYRLLTFYLKDSIVKKAEVLAASTEEQFNGKKIDSFSTKQYQLHITTFNYKIAQNIWGNYEIVLPKGFGYFENDRTVRGTFQCNNWKVATFKDLEEWIKLKPEKNRGFVIE